MTDKELKKFITGAAGDRTKLINSLLDELNKVVQQSQRELLSKFLELWVDKLDVDEATGRIKNTLRNKRLLSNVDTVFQQYVKTDGIAVAKTLIDGVKQILDFNGKYYKAFNTAAELVPIKDSTLEFMKSWLGLKGNGALEGNGYLAKTITDPKVLGEIKNFALRAVSGQQGYEATKSAVKEFIDGNKQGAGLLEKYYRNFVYDTYSQVDRVAASNYADKLKLDYAIYEGGLIKTSRKFCRERNGQVFTRAEIEQMEPAEAIPPNYNPITDMGGYGCRHHWNWIPYSVAIILRPDLKIAA